MRWEEDYYIDEKYEALKDIQSRLGKIELEIAKQKEREQLEKLKQFFEMRRNFLEACSLLGYNEEIVENIAIDFNSLDLFINNVCEDYNEGRFADISKEEFLNAINTISRYMLSDLKDCLPQRNKVKTKKYKY